MQHDFSVGKFRKPPNPLFHPESLAAQIVAKKPWLVRGHRKLKIVPENPVVFYVLYESPADFPNKFVLRKWWDQTPAKNPVCVTTTLVEALAHLPKNVRCLGRKAGEAACIKEVWTEISPGREDAQAILRS